MSSSEVEFILIEHEKETEWGPPGKERLDKWPPPSTNYERDREIERSITESASEIGLDRQTNTEYKSRDREGAAFYGGYCLATDIFHYITYGGVAAAGMAAFVKNVLGSLKEWKELRKGRSIQIVVRGEKITIEDTSEVEEILSKIDGVLKRIRKDDSHPSPKAVPNS